MGRGLLLWLVGVPIPVIILLWLFFGRLGRRQSQAPKGIAAAMPFAWRAVMSRQHDRGRRTKARYDI